jgi:hypothetical protein
VRAQALETASGEASGVQIHRENIQSGEIQLGRGKRYRRNTQNIVGRLGHSATTLMRRGHSRVAIATHAFATLFLLNRELHAWNGTLHCHPSQKEQAEEKLQAEIPLHSQSLHPPFGRRKRFPAWCWGLDRGATNRLTAVLEHMAYAAARLAASVTPAEKD